MHTFSRSRFTMALLLFALVTGASSASAQYTLNARYTGVITGIDDTYGVFSAARGSLVTGSIQYSSPVLPPDYVDPQFAEYIFPVTPGGATLMTAHFGSLNLQSTESVILDMSNFDDPNFPLYGYDFLFNDLNPTTTLSGGFQLAYFDADISLYGTDPAQFDFPTPPSLLLPLEQYDYLSEGSFITNVIDSNGHYLETASVSFNITSLQAVPEPGNLALLVGMGLSGAGFFARRKKVQQAA